MCLTVNRYRTYALLRRFAKTKSKKLKFWKVVSIFSGKPKSPFYDKVWKPGWNKSNAKRKQLCVADGTKINGSIHVCTTLGKAQNLLNEYRWVIQVECYESDFIAVGNNEDAVFTQVFLSESEYLKVMRLSYARR